jgi:hypothetical protein
MVVASYRTPSMKTRARVLDFISSYLSDGRSSKLYKKVVDEKEDLQIGAVGFSQEDYGMYIIYGLPMETHTAADLLNEIDEEVKFKRFNLRKIIKNYKISLKTNMWTTTLIMEVLRI